METVTSDPDLAQEVRGYLTHETTYDKACKGKRVEFVFTFRLEGTPEYTPLVWVKFQPPNRFVIVSRPQKAIAN